MTNLPVLHDTPLLTYRNPEELAAANHALTQLARIVSQHRKGYSDAPEEEIIEQFQYGQDWYTEPEVWEDPGDMWEL